MPVCPPFGEGSSKAPQAWVRSLALTNLTGHPEISMPNGFFQGSPTSLRFTGKLFGEAEILLLAHAYQAATDHHLQHPTL